MMPAVRATRSWARAFLFPPKSYLQDPTCESNGPDPLADLAA